MGSLPSPRLLRFAGSGPKLSYVLSGTGGSGIGDKLNRGVPGARTPDGDGRGREVGGYEACAWTDRSAASVSGYSDVGC